MASSKRNADRRLETDRPSPSAATAISPSIAWAASSEAPRRSWRSDVFTKSAPSTIADALRGHRHRAGRQPLEDHLHQPRRLDQRREHGDELPRDPESPSKRSIRATPGRCRRRRRRGAGVTSSNMSATGSPRDGKLTTVASTYVEPRRNRRSAATSLGPRRTPPVGAGALTLDTIRRCGPTSIIGEVGEIDQSDCAMCARSDSFQVHASNVSESDACNPTSSLIRGCCWRGCRSSVVSQRAVEVDRPWWCPRRC